MELSVASMRLELLHGLPKAKTVVGKSYRGGNRNANTIDLNGTFEEEYNTSSILDSTRQ